MAASGPIRVCVLEGPYAQLSQLGFPLSLAVELQSSNLRLDSSKWSTRRSNGGFSITFFWPTLPCGRKASRQTVRKRSRRQRNCKSKSLPNLCQDPAATSVSKPSPVAQPLPSLFTAHHDGISLGTVTQSNSPCPSTVLSETASDTSERPGLPTSASRLETDEQSMSSDTDANSDTSSPVQILEHLLRAESLEFEIRKDIPGIKSTIAGECNWTPVSVKQPSLNNEFTPDFLRGCEDVGVVKIGSMLRARVHTKSATFLTLVVT